VVLLVLLLFALMLVPEVPRLVQRRQWPELAAFMALWAAGLALSLLITFDVDVGHLNRFLRSLFEPIGKMFLVPPD